MRGGATPSHTPLREGMTPSREAGGMTPSADVWKVRVCLGWLPAASHRAVVWQQG